MKRLGKKMGAVAPAPALQSSTDISTKLMAIPASYSKENRFTFNGAIIRFRGGRAYLLDLLIIAKPAGVDRSMTWVWCANIADTIKALKAKGVQIGRVKGTYTLQSNVQRIDGVA